MDRLRNAIGADATLLVKRDDAIPFGFGGNKVRKLSFVAAHAQQTGAGALVTCGGVQSNHARATSAVAARLGMRCVLVANGSPPPVPTANARLNQLLGAEIVYVATREARTPAMEAAAADLRAQGCRPFVIPLGASTGLGAAAYVDAVTELAAQIDPPDVIVHASSSGGTQAGLVAGCALNGWPTRVIGISADDPSDVIRAEIRRVLGELEDLLDAPRDTLSGIDVEIDDAFVGGGYGVPTPASTEAMMLCARCEGFFVDHTYTAKAMAALLARVRSGALNHGTVLFWHTGGQVGVFR
jgi:1-aminocyclopropane-1-carboxylate deaminase/D-cysteine desulfhydrase-like pyridoxal-dependent ACC family enzyme